MDFTNKVVIITGGSAGIGAASALIFAKHGAKLSLVGRNEERMKTVIGICQQASGLEHLYILLDLTKKGSCATVISKTIAKYGRIDVLVNSAAKIVIGSLFDDNDDAFEEMIDIHLRVPYKLTRLALPHLKKTRGNVINFNQTKHARVRHGFLPFSIAKAGVEKFSTIAALELAGENVRVNCIQPGVTRTNMLYNLDMDEEEIQKAYERLSEHMPIMEPEEVAKMVLFVASRVCPNLNGANVRINAASSLL